MRLGRQNYEGNVDASAAESRHSLSGVAKYEREVMLFSIQPRNDYSGCWGYGLVSKFLRRDAGRSPRPGQLTFF